MEKIDWRQIINGIINNFIYRIKHHKGELNIGIAAALIILCFLCVLITPGNDKKEEEELMETMLLCTKAEETISAGAFLPTHIAATIYAELTEQVTPIPTKTTAPTATVDTYKQIFNIYPCLPKDTTREIAKVISITDGDTIQVEINGNVFPLRYIGIDSPEAFRIRWADQATEENRQLVMGKEVLLIKDVSERDSFNRLLRYVIVDGMFVNYELVKKGAAIAIKYDPDTACSEFLSIALNDALESGVGMWGGAMMFMAPVESDTKTESEIIGETCQCNCAIDYDCGDFNTHREAQRCFDCCGGSTAYNWSRLDRDRDGIACETLP